MSIKDRGIVPPVATGIIFGIIRNLPLQSDFFPHLIPDSMPSFS